MLDALEAYAGIGEDQLPGPCRVKTPPLSSLIPQRAAHDTAVSP